MAVPAGHPSEPVSALRAHLGAELRRRRDEAGLTQAALAMRVRYARAYVAQVESARELPSAAFVLACDQALDARGALMEIFRRIDNERRAQRRPAPATLTLAHAEDALWTPDDAPEAASVPPTALDPDLERREFLRHMTAAPGAAVIPPSAHVDLDRNEPWRRLTAALHGRTRVDGTTVDNLERVTVALEELESQVSPKALIGPVLGHLDTVTRLLEGSLRPSVRRRLCSIAAETAGLAGWLMWDQEDPHAAAAYFRAALDAADEADDKALGAYLVGSAACQPAYREQPDARLGQLTGRTFGFAASDATPGTRAWLATLEAEAHSLTGDEDAARRSLDRAEEAIRAGMAISGPRPRVTFFDETYLAGEVGVTLSRLGHAEEAARVLGEALSALDPSKVKTKPRLLTSLASARIQGGEIEEATRLAHAALADSQKMQVEPNLEVVRQVRRQLEPWRDHSAVRDLDELLRNPRPGTSP